MLGIYYTQNTYIVNILEAENTLSILRGLKIKVFNGGPKQQL